MTDSASKLSLKMHINECLLKAQVILRMALMRVEATISDAVSCPTEFPHQEMLAVSG